jgi:Thymidylate synthase
MIIVKTHTLMEAAKAAFLALYDGAENASDPSIFREDTAVIEVSHPNASQQAFMLRGKTLVYEADYLKYFPFEDAATPKIEEDYFTKAFIETGQIDAILSYLQREPYGRRALISVWSPTFLHNNHQSSACITQLYFRLRNRQLEVHSHSRANDAYRLLLLDMQFSCWVQSEVSRLLGVSVGRYIHFVDSLQLYSKHLPSINRQRTFFQTALEWQ